MHIEKKKKKNPGYNCRFQLLFPFPKNRSDILSARSPHGARSTVSEK